MLISHSSLGAYRLVSFLTFQPALLSVVCTCVIHSASSQRLGSDPYTDPLFPNSSISSTDSTLFPPAACMKTAYTTQIRQSPPPAHIHIVNATMPFFDTSRDQDIEL